MDNNRHAVVRNKYAYKNIRKWSMVITRSWLRGKTIMGRVSYWFIAIILGQTTITRCTELFSLPSKIHYLHRNCLKRCFPTSDWCDPPVTINAPWTFYRWSTTTKMCLFNFKIRSLLMSENQVWNIEVVRI